MESAPFPEGPPNDGGVIWLGVIQRPDRLAFSRVYAAVSTVLSARAFPRLSVVQGRGEEERAVRMLGIPAQLYREEWGRLSDRGRSRCIKTPLFTHKEKGTFSKRLPS